MTHRYTNACLTFDGEEFPISEVTIERHEPEPPSGIVTVPSGTFEYTATTAVPVDWWAIDRLLAPPIRGATDATLAKRVTYGGRKGRSAMRRLRRKGYVGTIEYYGQVAPLPPVVVETKDGQRMQMSTHARQFWKAKVRT